MMGTGEASGDKRALMAAEAAIANPLLDEVSMKGAKGLLISITGGKDMMLYELDEAATRIREEVDPEANIILGATQDDSLEGIIRVSVVATGIDRASIEAIEPVNPVEQRIADMAQRLRAQVAAKQVTPEPVMPLIRAKPAEAAPVEAPAAAPAQPTIAESAPIAAAVAEPMPALVEAPAPQADIQPAVEPAGPIIRPARLPQIEDFPVVAQQQLRAAQIQQPVHAPAHEAKRMTLLQRLAAVGLGRRDEAEGAPAAPAAVAAPAVPAVENARRQPQPQASRAAAGQLDSHGRPQPRSIEDDQLEIPAFLRRQVS
jgi:cell division protein FtsZ